LPKKPSSTITRTREEPAGKPHAPAHPGKTKNPQQRVFCLGTTSSLGELRRTTCGFESVFLSFLHTRIAGQQTCLFEGGLVVLISQNQGTCNTVADGACLTGDTAAADVGNNVKLAGGFGHTERLVYDEFQRVQTKVLINALAIDGDAAGAGIQTNAGNGFLTSAGSVEVRLCTCT